jgi:signal peptidase I
MSKRKQDSQDTGKDRKPEGPAGASPEPSKESSPKKRRPFDAIRDNLEAIGVAVVLALIIRHFSVEAFEIPTGSMANTLFGMHAWLQCPNCSTEYNVALQSDSSTGEISVRYPKILVYDGPCPNPGCALRLHGRGPGDRHLQRSGDAIVCGSCASPFRGSDPSRYRYTEATETDARCPICHHVVHAAVLERNNLYGGHKILVTKFAYTTGRPRRWDVIVFEFDQWRNYIKRLIGLPGERIDVWDGDVYVDGKIERKTRYPDVQNGLWTKISDSDVAERGLNRKAAWTECAPKGSRRAPELGKNAQWNADTKRWTVNALKDVALLSYQRGFDNYYNYNLLLPMGGGIRGCPAGIQVGDKKVAFAARVVGGPSRDSGRASWIGAEIRDGDFTFQLRIPVGSSGEATVTRLVADPDPAPSPDRKEHESGLKVAAPASLAIGRAAKIEFESVDDRVAARLDGEEILSLEYTSLPQGRRPQDRPPSPGEDAGGHCVHLIVSDAQVELESIRVYRDLYYIAFRGNEPWEGIQLGEGEYFAMGDNAPSSSDGRYWKYIPEKNLIGKAFVVIWPAWPKNFQWKFIR